MMEKLPPQYDDPEPAEDGTRIEVHLQRIFKHEWGPRSDCSSKLPIIFTLSFNTAFEDFQRQVRQWWLETREAFPYAVVWSTWREESKIQKTFICEHDWVEMRGRILELVKANDLAWENTAAQVITKFEPTCLDQGCTAKDMGELKALLNIREGICRRRVWRRRVDVS